MKKKLEVIWCVVLWAVLLLMIGCAHRPPTVAMQATKCRTMNVKTQGSEIVTIYLCSTFFDKGLPDNGRIP